MLSWEFSVKNRFVVMPFSPLWLELINATYCLLKVFIIHLFLLLNFYFQMHLNGSSCSLENFSSKTDLLLRPLALYDLNLSMLIKGLYYPFVLVTDFLFSDTFKWKFMLSWEFSIKNRFVVVPFSSCII